MQSAINDIEHISLSEPNTTKVFSLATSRAHDLVEKDLVPAVQAAFLSVCKLHHFFDRSNTLLFTSASRLNQLSSIKISHSFDPWDLLQQREVSLETEILSPQQRIEEDMIHHLSIEKATLISKILAESAGNNNGGQGGVSEHVAARIRPVLSDLEALKLRSKKKFFTSAHSLVFWAWRKVFECAIAQGNENPLLAIQADRLDSYISQAAKLDLEGYMQDSRDTFELEELVIDGRVALGVEDRANSTSEIIFQQNLLRVVLQDFIKKPEAHSLENIFANRYVGNETMDGLIARLKYRVEQGRHRNYTDLSLLFRAHELRGRLDESLSFFDDLQESSLGYDRVLLDIAFQIFPDHPEMVFAWAKRQIPVAFDSTKKVVEDFMVNHGADMSAVKSAFSAQVSGGGAKGRARAQHMPDQVLDKWADRFLEQLSNAYSQSSGIRRRGCGCTQHAHMHAIEVPFLNEDSNPHSWATSFRSWIHFLDKLSSEAQDAKLSVQASVEKTKVLQQARNHELVLVLGSYLRRTFSDSLEPLHQHVVEVASVLDEIRRGSVNEGRKWQECRCYSCSK